ncbi:MAG: transcription antitermination protein NusB [Vicingaceae bacterium]
MFNRRFLRVKIFQALYAHFQKDSTEILKSQNELQLSISRTFDLFLYLLILPVELKAQGEKRLEESTKKAMPTSEDLNPNFRFVNNCVIETIANSTRIKKLTDMNKINWSAQMESVSRFYKFMRESDAYKKYMATAENGLKEDKDMLMALYRDVLPKFDLFSQTFHEMSIYWDEEDFDYARYLALQTIKKLGPDLRIDKLIKDAYENEEDKNFVIKLFNETLKLSDETEQLIMDKAQNWDADRIALLDMIIMKMAVSEILHFNQIPVKVSMNEYIDISKSFSSPKSGQFINGIIDKVVQELHQQKRFVKVGRGLFEG